MLFISGVSVKHATWNFLKAIGLHVLTIFKYLFPVSFISNLPLSPHSSPLCFLPILDTVAAFPLHHITHSTSTIITTTHSSTTGSQDYADLGFVAIMVLLFYRFTVESFLFHNNLLCIFFVTNAYICFFKEQPHLK